MRIPNTDPIATLALPDGITFSVFHRSMAYANELHRLHPEFRASHEDHFVGEVTGSTGTVLGGPWTFPKVKGAVTWAERASKEDLEDLEGHEDEVSKQAELDQLDQENLKNLQDAGYPFGSVADMKDWMAEWEVSP